MIAHSKLNGIKKTSIILVFFIVYNLTTLILKIFEVSYD